MVPKEAIRFPKMIIHVGKEWDVIQDEKSEGASWKHETSQITIGTKGQPMEIFERIFHELFEMTMTSMFTRYYNNHDDQNYLFVLDHRAFQTALELTMPVALQFLRFNSLPELDSKSLTDYYVEELCAQAGR